MAVGPAGFSVGVRHHVVIKPATEVTGPGLSTEIFPQFNPELDPAQQPFRVFGSADQPDLFRGQPLSLGSWTAISGDAVSTGLGSHGSLATSLLTGFVNLRLGYWWDSGTSSLAAGQKPLKKDATVCDHMRRFFQTKLSRNLGRGLTWLFPVQSSLIDEFLGRFHGTLRRYWYLTDGGHFEDLAGYELIRRRLPLIVIVDAEADGAYDFAELANLIRKARLDFNAEIKFIDPATPDGKKEMEAAQRPLQDLFRSPHWELIGTLDELRRGEWDSEPLPNPDGNPPNLEHAYFKSADSSRLSRKRAALAKITYLDDADRKDADKKVSYLLLIKPTLTGDEPQDVLNYHASHPAFPQQTTADQFFDEAQWESYRRLGQHIATKLFSLSEA